MSESARQEWPVQWISRHAQVSFVSACDTREEAERIGDEAELYIPLSQLQDLLTSDEVVEALAKVRYEASRLLDASPPRWDVLLETQRRSHLTAAADHLQAAATTLQERYAAPTP
jgi:hypothetical protein